MEKPGVPRERRHRERPLRGTWRWKDVPSGTASTARLGLPALFSPIVLHFLPACARLRGGVPAAAPMATAGHRPSPPAISRLLFPCLCEAASAALAHLHLLRGPAPHGPSYRHPSLNNNNNSSHRSSFGLGRHHRGPWGRVALGPRGGHPASCLQLPFTEGGDVRCHTQKCALGL